MPPRSPSLTADNMRWLPNEDVASRLQPPTTSRTKTAPAVFTSPRQVSGAQSRPTGPAMLGAYATRLTEPRRGVLAANALSRVAGILDLALEETTPRIASEPALAQCDKRQEEPHEGQGDDDSRSWAHRLTLARWRRQSRRLEDLTGARGLEQLCLRRDVGVADEAQGARAGHVDLRDLGDGPGDPVHGVD